MSYGFKYTPVLIPVLWFVSRVTLNMFCNLSKPQCPQLQMGIMCQPKSLTWRGKLGSLFKMIDMGVQEPLHSSLPSTPLHIPHYIISTTHLLMVTCWDHVISFYCVCKLLLHHYSHYFLFSQCSSFVLLQIPINYFWWRLCRCYWFY